MKIFSIVRSLTLFLSSILLCNSLINCLSLRTETKTMESATLKMRTEQIAQLWQKLFTAGRTETCAQELMKREMKKSLVNSDGKDFMSGKKGMSVEAAWIKRWGYGDAAYLFDFLDPIFQSIALSEFNNIYEALRKIDSKDTKDYQDPLDISKQISPDNLHMNGKINLSNLNKNYDPAIYALSINTVQLHHAMKKWNWPIGVGQEDYAFDFVTKYDFDGDGRLNPRELIIGAIMHLKDDMSHGSCQYCFQEFAQTLDSIFIFIDCTNEGTLSAEELWRALPKLARGTEKWNIFSIWNNDNIRTSAVNDFVIKNGFGKEGSVTKDEFRMGVMLGYWDRQTTKKSILSDDSRTLKTLRWDKPGIKDTVAFKYYTEATLAKLMAKSMK